MRRSIIAAVAAVAVLAGAPVAAQQPAEEGVRVGPASFVRQSIRRRRWRRRRCCSTTSCASRRSPGARWCPTTIRRPGGCSASSQEIKPHTYKWHKRAKDWTWDTLLIKSPAINALCMPGGKIAVFTGILDQLKLTDDELAMVIGHEMAHALREHARERAAKNMLTNVGALAVGVLIGGGAGDIARMGGGLLSLSFSRDNEQEADLVGMELAARAGYNPEAALSLWEKMGQRAEDLQVALAVDASHQRGAHRRDQAQPAARGAALREGQGDEAAACARPDAGNSAGAARARACARADPGNSTGAGQGQLSASRHACARSGVLWHIAQRTG